MDQEGRSPFGRGKRVSTPKERFQYPRMGSPEWSGKAPGAPPTNHPATVMNKTYSAASYQSSSSSRIRHNTLETEKKIDKLREDIEEAKQVHADFSSDIKHAERRLEALQKKQKTDDVEKAIEELEAEINTLQLAISKQEHKVKRMEDSFDRRKSIIESEAKVKEQDILEEHDQDLSDGEDPVNNFNGNENEKLERVDAWVDNITSTEAVENRKVKTPPPQQPTSGMQNPATNWQTPPTGSQGLFPPPPPGFFPFYYAPPEPSQQFPVQVPAQQNTEMLMLASAIKDLAVSTDKKAKELPYFNGDPEDWPLFKNEFDRSTAKLPRSEANTINLSRLRKALKGKAEATVHHLLSNTENVPDIIRSLEKRFGQAKFVLESLIEKAKSALSPNYARPDTIIEFGIAVQGLVTNIKSFNEVDYLHSMDLLKTLVRKLPTDMRRGWYTWLDEDGDRKENLQHFESWITKEVNIAYRSCEPSCKDEEKPKRHRHVGVVPGKEEKRKKEAFCVNCKLEGHHIRVCRTFAKLPDDDKLKLVREKRLCFCCLITGHRSRDCNLKKKCDVSGCDRDHHPLLHDCDQDQHPKPNGQRPARKEESPPDGKKVDAVRGNLGNVNAMDTDDLLWYVPVVVTGPTGKKKHCYAMLDIGAQLSLLDWKLAEELELEGDDTSISVGVFNGKESKMKSKRCNIEIAGDYRNAEVYPLKSVYLTRELDLPEQTVNVEKWFENYPRLRAAPIRSQDKVKPLVLIGNPHWRTAFPSRCIEQSKTSPAAVKTPLGWLPVGAEGKSVMSQKGVFHLRATHLEIELNEMVKDFICMDNFGVKDVPSLRSKEDEKALTIMEKTTKRVGDRWETGLLYRDSSIHPPESKQAALKRLHFMEKKADRDQTFAELYTSRFEEYISKGYLQEIDLSALKETKHMFLPTFFANHPNKKPRLVFDAAAKANGYSFNDFFYTGPDLLVPLPKVLLRFRRHKVGLIGDITAMFHQVKLKDEDQLMQLIMYRGMDRDKPPRIFKMTRLFFGSVCSPASACYVKDHNAKEFETQYPAAVKAITTETYMDDFHSGGETDEEAIKLQQEVTLIHAKGGFPITKWSSSSIAVVNAIPEQLRAAGDRFISVKSDLPMEKTLGLLWNPGMDVFAFQLSKEKISTALERPTKRKLASFIMSLFDPLGFVTPLKIKGLIIFQSTWRLGIGWDDEITANLDLVWKEWIAELMQVENVTIPRCVRRYGKVDTTYELHTFCDASEEAYVAVTYLRGVSQQEIEVAFVVGKGRVAPIKGLSIPRMELNAAVMGARLAATVKETYGSDLLISKSHYWTDSRTVLCWLRSEKGRFSQFVSNRIAEILGPNHSNPEEWHWVPSKDNVADDATRSGMKMDFTSSCRWLKGSDFLYKKEEYWPVQKEDCEPKLEDLEKRKEVMVLTRSPFRLPLPNEMDYSSWYSLIRKTAKWMAAFEFLMKKGMYRITPSHLEAAEKMWSRQVQQDSFKEELSSLTRGNAVDKKSPLYKLSPTMKDGLIVIQGRIGNAANISDSVKYPVILDPHHYYTRLLVQWSHIINAHQGQETVINNLRKKYWILDCRTLVRSVILKCGTCAIERAKPVPQVMGDLPEGRMASNEPAFTHTGVDLFGPMEVTVGRRHEKRWGVLYTCLTTRAVYIDLVPSLSSSDFIDCLMRFNSRRGPAKHIWSDNGTNLRGADNELKKCLQDWNQNQITESCLSRGSEWHFIAPASPHMGGSYERMIGLAKKILRRILKCQAPKEFTLLTLLCEVEAIMNSRPLSVTSPDPKDPECITPNHLLKLRCVPGQFVPGDFLGGKQNRRMWRYAQQLAESFWKRWKDEVLPALIPRKKWNEDNPSLREGDIVLLLDDQADRNDWKKGVILKTYPGRDKRVRVVEVKLPVVDGSKEVSYKILRRHVMKVCPIGVNVLDKTASYGREEYSGVNSDNVMEDKESHLQPGNLEPEVGYAFPRASEGEI